MTEKEFLNNYDYTSYARPSVAADIVIFAVMTDNDDFDKVRSDSNIRKMPEKKLKVLLIKRANHPYINCYALPGGFVRKDEDVYETAERELFEETNIKQSYLRLMDVYSKKNRDPRGWIMSNTFMALVDGRNCNLRADSDAWEAKWFDLAMNIEEMKNECKDNVINTLTKYELTLTSEDGKDIFKPSIEIETVYKNYHKKSEIKEYKGDGLAFDHGIIILNTWLELRNLVELDSRIIFDLMPECFTFAELQSAFELVLDTKLTTPNFRRKIKDYCVETDKILEGAGHRPAKLFARNLERFR